MTRRYENSVQKQNFCISNLRFRKLMFLPNFRKFWNKTSNDAKMTYVLNVALNDKELRKNQNLTYF